MAAPLPRSSDEREIITFPSVGESQRGIMNQITKAQLAVIIRPRVEEILDLMRRRLAALRARLRGQRSRSC